MSGTAKARLLLVDDHPIVRTGIRIAISDLHSLEICGEADSVPSALALLEKERPDLMVLDLNLGGRDGVELIRQVLSLYPEIKILVFSMNAEEVYAQRVLRAGARGYVMKKEGLKELVVAIENVLSGKVWISRTLSDRLVSEMASSPKTASASQIDRIESLTDRELQVLRLIGMGRMTHQIARELKLSVKTIGTHRENLKSKLGLRNAAELAREAAAYVARL